MTFDRDICAVAAIPDAPAPVVADPPTVAPGEIAAGIKPCWPIRHGSVKAATAFMASGNFAANSIGVAYDPEELPARNEAEVSEAAWMMLPLEML